MATLKIISLSGLEGGSSVTQVVSGNSSSTGTVNILNVDSTSLPDALIAPGQMNIFYDETADKLKVKVNEDGTIMSGDITAALS